jgi:hypothetical protein
MPNWCNNTIEISHPDKSKMDALIASVNEGKFCNHVIPVPASLQIVAGRVGDDSDPKQIELEATQKSNLATHGYKDWYDFQVNEWGTKWDVEPYNPVAYEVNLNGDPLPENKIVFGFDSAWAPPCGVADALIDQGYAVRLYYYESGMCFAGIYDENGDDFYELGGMSSTEVADSLPSVLDDMFGISECIAEYEAENAEEEEELHTWVVEGAEAKKEANE